MKNWHVCNFLWRLKNELFSDAMFGLRKSTELEVPPCPPTAEEIIEDLEKAGPDDVVFTTEINATDLDPLPNTFNLTKRFQVCRVFCVFMFYWKNLTLTFILFKFSQNDHYSQLMFLIA